ncbi:DoxX family protein [Sandaracinobacter sp. RS1-74]|uniref:DoxX family protein n=1 Tax=Sandaracinobacteroides sayramensis TaxID=2913411 RepID=UPI001EDBC3C1|nr:DoxX family protein [Sandaracinobacteroides sayramensis]MCG2840628.1 DoxX family protein [Sandaracinobacteroides sayramensis]
MGWTLTGLFTLFLLAASIAPKLVGAEVAGETLRQLGWPDNHVFLLGLIELACLALYLFPRSSVAGAILMTASLGGAVSTQFRVGNPVFSHLLFGVYLGLFMWGGLWLRDASLRAIFPLRAQNKQSDSARLGQ